MVGILGIEPSVGLPDGFTVRCRTLRRDAQIVTPSGERSHMQLLEQPHNHL